MTTFAYLTGLRLQTTYLELSESTYPGGLVQDAHGHHPAYVTCVVTGAYEERIAGVTRRVEEGAVLYHPAQEEHAVQFRTPTTRVCRLTPTPALLECARLAGATFDAAPRVAPLLADFTSRVRSLAAVGSPEAVLSIDTLASEFVVSLRTRRARGPASVPPGAIRAVREYLDKHGHHGVSLAELAKLAGCHPVTLTRAFRRQTGRSIGAYLRHRMLEQACRLLREGTLPLSLVAADAGFADQAHLTRALRRATGQTPGQMRERRP